MLKKHCMLVVFFVIFITTVTYAFEIPPLSNSREKIPFHAVQQNSVLFFRNQTEKLIVQFDYKGNADSVAWVIPFPSKPTVRTVMFSPFEELSQFYGKSILQTPFHDAFNLKSINKMFNSALSLNMPVSDKENPPLNRKKTNISDSTVFKTSNIKGIKKWLKENNFEQNTEISKMINSYSGKNYYWLAMKINIKPEYKIHSPYADNGSIPPIMIEFKTKTPYIPINPLQSAGNNQPFNVYLISDKIYTPSNMKKLTFSIPTVTHLGKKIYDYTLKLCKCQKLEKKECKLKCRKKISYISPINYCKLNEIIPSLYASIPETADEELYYMSFRLNLSNTSPTQNITFSSDANQISKNITALIKKELDMHYAFTPENSKTSFKIPQNLTGKENSKKKNLKFFLANNSTATSWKKNKTISKEMIKALTEQKLLKIFATELTDKTDKLKLLNAFVNAFDKIPDISLYPLFRKTIPEIISTQSSKVAEILLHQLNVDYSFKYSFVSNNFNEKNAKIPQTLTTNEEKLLFYALSMLYYYHDTLACKDLLPWLNNSDKKCRMLAINIIAASLKNDKESAFYNCSLNRRAMLFNTLSDSQKSNLTYSLTNSIIQYPISSSRCIYLLHYLKADNLNETIASVLNQCADVFAENIDKLSGTEQALFHKKITDTSNLILLYMRIFPNKSFTTPLTNSLGKIKFSQGWGIDYQNLLWTAWSNVIYKADINMREVLFTKKIINQITNPPDFKRDSFSALKEYLFYIASDPKNQLLSKPHFSYLYPGYMPLSLTDFLLEKIKNIQDDSLRKTFLKKLTYSFCISFDKAEKSKISALLKYINLMKNNMYGTDEYRRVLECAMNSPLYNSSQVVRDAVFTLDNIKAIAYSKELYPYGVIKSSKLTESTVEFLIKKIKNQNVFLQKKWLASLVPSITSSLRYLLNKKKIKINNAAKLYKQLFEISEKNPGTKKTFVYLLKKAIGLECINTTEIQKIVFSDENIAKLAPVKVSPVSSLSYETISYLMKIITKSDKKTQEQYIKVLTPSILKSLAYNIRKDKNNLKALSVLSAISENNSIFNFSDKETAYFYKLFFKGKAINSLIDREKIFSARVLSALLNSKNKILTTNLNEKTITWILRKVMDSPEQTFALWWKTLGPSIFASMRHKPNSNYNDIIIRYCDVIINKNDTPVPVSDLIKTAFSKPYMNDTKIQKVIYSPDFINKFYKEISENVKIESLPENVRVKLKALNSKK